MEGWFIALIDFGVAFDFIEHPQCGQTGHYFNNTQWHNAFGDACDANGFWYGPTNDDNDNPANNNNDDDEDKEEPP